MTTIKNFMFSNNFNLNSILGYVEIEDCFCNSPTHFSPDATINAVKGSYNENYNEVLEQELINKFRYNRDDIGDENLITLVCTNECKWNNIKVGDYIATDDGFICNGKISVKEFANMVSQYTTDNKSLKDVDEIHIYQPVGSNWLVSIYTNINTNATCDNFQLDACAI